MADILWWGIFERIFLIENCYTLNKILLKFVLKGTINNKSLLVQGNSHLIAHTYTDNLNYGLFWNWINHTEDQWPLLLTWFNFNPSMDK